MLEVTEKLSLHTKDNSCETINFEQVKIFLKKYRAYVGQAVNAEEH